MLFRLLPLFAILVGIVSADFSASFNKFLTDKYGKNIDDLLARRDIGPHGSYGGGTHDGSTRTRKQAVILVHGITNTAGTFQGHRNHLLNAGWSDELTKKIRIRTGSRFRSSPLPISLFSITVIVSLFFHVYATTYGDGGKTVMPLVDMKCQYIKQVRFMIQVVAAFTRRKVDVIGYSLGSPVSRKAIMGGACVDTGENLGPPLTALIDTYVSVAGANRGSFLCALPFPGACNANNGLSCNSRYIQDINSRQRYEGKYIFSIYGPGDDKVGFRNTCGQLTSQIAGANGEYEKPGNHDDVIIKTAGMQFNLIDKHSP